MSHRHKPATCSLFEYDCVYGLAVYYSLFFLNGRAEKNLQTDPGAILAVIVGYCRHVKTELLRIESMRIVVVTGKEELLHGRHEAISGRLSPSCLCSASMQGPPTQHAFIRQTEDNLILCRATIHDPNIHRGVFNTFLFHQAVYRVQMQKQMAAE